MAAQSMASPGEGGTFSIREASCPAIESPSVASPPGRHCAGSLLSTMVSGRSEPCGADVPRPGEVNRGAPGCSRVQGAGRPPAPASLQLEPLDPAALLEDLQGAAGHA